MKQKNVQGNYTYSTEQTSAFLKKKTYISTYLLAYSCVQKKCYSHTMVGFIYTFLSSLSFASSTLESLL